MVEVEGDSSGFPFELLPVFDQGRPGAMDDIETFARRFLGFSTTVRRTPYVTKGRAGGGAAALDNDPKLPVTFSWYAPYVRSSPRSTTSSMDSPGTSS